MINPVEAERRYAVLLDQLDGSISFKQQWLLIGDFLSFIEPHYTTYDTHLLQLAESMPVFKKPLSFSGVDPEVFATTLEKLNQCESSIPELTDSQNYLKAREALCCAVTFLYLCLHEYDLTFETVFGEDRISFEFKEGEPVDALLARMHSYAQSQKLETPERIIQQLKEWWAAVHKQDKNKLLIPVVEESSEGTTGGRLRRLSVRVTGENKTADVFRNSYSVYGAEKEGNGIHPNVAKACRAIIDKSHAGLKNCYFEMQFNFDLRFGLHEGRSSELGCYILGYSAALDYVRNREQFYPTSKVAVTGRIGPENTVATIDEQSIGPKVRAAFFSWVEYLVVPERQRSLFLQQVKILQERYSSRPLTIIGTEEPEDFFFDRRIANHVIDSRTKHFFKRAWAKKFSVAGIILMLLMLLVIGRLWYGPIDKNPVTGRFEGRQLNIYNKNDALLKSFNIGFENNVYEEWNGSEGSKPQVQFYDLNQDEINEVFWYEIPLQETSSTNTLKAWSLTGDSLIRELPLEFEINFPRKNSIVDSEYFVYEFHIEEVGDRQVMLAVNAGLKAFFPAVIFTVNAHSGDLLQQYVHAGHFYDMAMKDINGDGLSEIIATGVSNVHWKAVITVLDINRLQGHGPVEGDYIIENFKPAEELSYILVPKTILGQQYDLTYKYSIGRRIQILSGERLLSFHIDEAPRADSPGAVSPYILLYMNPEMEPQGIGTSDSYDIRARDLYREGSIPFIPDYDYFEAFKDSLLYWDGEGFVRNLNDP